jgi:hypothetical protein
MTRSEDKVIGYKQHKELCIKKVNSLLESKALKLIASKTLKEKKT